MACDARKDRVLMRVITKDVGAVKKGLEELGIIYAEEDRGVCFSVLPTQRKEDFHRVNGIFYSLPR